MSGTQITQYRQPVLLDTGTKYQVSASCTLAGTLPDTAIFVVQIVDFEDPKNDAFYRVASPSDFLTIGNNRVEAIEAGPGDEGAYLYRATSFTQSYDDVDVATGAWNELSGRINTLVLDYDTYVSAFLTPPDGSVTTYPTVDPSVKAALISDYESALSAISTAEELRDTENVACEALRLELRTAQEALMQAQADVAALTPIVGSLAASSGVLSSISSSILGSVSSATALVIASAASPGEQSAILAQHNAISNQASLLGTTANSVENNVYVPLAGLLTEWQTRVAELQVTVSSLTLEVNDCALEMATLQSNVDVARANRSTALAALRAVCPDYTI